MYVIFVFLYVKLNLIFVKINLMIVIRRITTIKLNLMVVIFLFLSGKNRFPSYFNAFFYFFSVYYFLLFTKKSMIYE